MPYDRFIAFFNYNWKTRILQIWRLWWEIKNSLKFYSKLFLVNSNFSLFKMPQLTLFLDPFFQIWEKQFFSKIGIPQYIQIIKSWPLENIWYRFEWKQLTKDQNVTKTKRLTTNILYGLSAIYGYKIMH